MKRMTLVILCLLSLGLAILPQSLVVSRSLRTLIEAERAFAQASAFTGIREAFLIYLAPDSIVFRPKPVPGRPVYEQMTADSPVFLTWKPAFAEASRAGELGYTTGPYEAKDRSKPGQPSGFGHYVSLWKKQPNGLWKVILDAGVRHARPPSTPGEVVTREAEKGVKRPGRVDPIKGRADLLDAERELVQKAKSEGLLQAYLYFADSDIRVYRDNVLPALGLEALATMIITRSGELSSDPIDGEISSSGDLGYVYGISERKSGSAGTPIESSSFLRIWRKGRDGKWKIALDLAVPIPFVRK